MANLKRKLGLKYMRNKVVLTLLIVLIFYCIVKLINGMSTGPIEEQILINNTSCSREPKPVSQDNNSKVRVGYFVPKSLNKIDWHNYKLIKKDLQRVGLGEQGRPANVPYQDKDIEELLFPKYGFNAALSIHIALTRSLPDLRHEGCRSKLYLNSLPTVSVVVPFHNEHWSTLLRTVYSVINRSPPQLLKEIFLVDDGSTKIFLKKQLNHFISGKFPKVEVIRLYKRSGLVTARLAGAKKVTADVIIFLDAHAEATHNWLPPLLEPIAFNYRTVVCPYIGVIAYDTFKFWMADTGARGGFNWHLDYGRLPMLPKDRKNMPEPFESPVMAGGLFAISYKFFWELGGYDPGLAIWGGEHFELSFKIWMCGGRMLDAPCSIVGHIYKKHSPFIDAGIGDYLSKNHRRVAEVWMDEYAQYLYNRTPSIMLADPGDISKQRALRENLKCKSFRWYMTQIAFDVAIKFPPVEHVPYASGKIRPVSHMDRCVDANHGNDWSRLLLAPCLYHPGVDQKFVFGWLKDIKSPIKNMCWDLPDPAPRSPILLYECHGEQGNQYWRYFPDRKQIVHIKSNECLAWNPPSFTLFIDICDNNSETQKWMVDNVNKEMMDKWENYNLEVTGPVEKYDFD